MSVPILFITFNRPEETRRVLSEILCQNPEELYVFQDGPREGNQNDEKKCPEVRKVIEDMIVGLGYKLHFHSYYSKENLGCGRGPFTAISWFFQNVEQGVVFEDDCVPHPDFFKYCEELLERYKDDERVSFIGGCNYNDKSFGLEPSYGFCSGHHETWGWASWRRSWKLMDYSLKSISEKDFRKIINHYFRTMKHKEYWWMIYSMVKKDQMQGSCWDYQFYFSCWKHNMMAIYPKGNLVSNVGSGKNATHTSSKSNPLLARKVVSIMPLTHPKEMKLDVDYDYWLTRNYDLRHEYGKRGFLRIPFRVNRWLKRQFRHEGSWFSR